VKPVEGAYGLGVTWVTNESELTARLHKAKAELRESPFARFLSRSGPPRWMVESYLDGLELSIEVLGHPVAPQVLAVHEKVVAEREGEFREDRFLTAPAHLSRSALEQVETEAVRICRMLGFTRGVGNLEARITSRGLGVLELQTCPTGGLVADMVQASHGLNLHELHVRAYLDPQPLCLPLSRRERACVMDILHVDRPGPFRISGIEETQSCPGVKLLEILAEEGVVVAPHSEYLGFIVCEGQSPSQAVALLETARKVLRIETSNS
jgi:biotin carboxylase